MESAAGLAAGEMEMRAAEEIEIGQDITMPLSCVAFSLYDSFLSSHCSFCFSPISAASPQSPSLLYCSTACSVSDFPLRLPQPLSDFSPLLSSDIRAALRLLTSLSISFTTAATAFLPHRIGGLLTNYLILMADTSLSFAIRRAATVMASARGSRGGGWDRNGTVLEEAAICLVITNAVEVQDSIGRALGVAVYDALFSWINHSCSPNACYRFVISSPITPSFLQDSSEPKIIPHVMNTEKGGVDTCSSSEYWQGTTTEYGPRVIVRSIRRIKKGEEVTVSYTDLLQPKALRQSDLWSKYRFVCCCRRCTASPPAYIDSVLEGIHASQPFNDHETFSTDEATRSMADSIKEAIDKFLSDKIDSKTCCEIIEHVLNHGVEINHTQVNEANMQLCLRLHPLHHAALNAYMTLSSAYKVNSSELIAVDSLTDVDRQKSLDLIRISAAYSLFLAGATHHLFSSEPSLVVSAANFWTNAGESLLTLPMIHELRFTKCCSSTNMLEALFSNNVSTRNRGIEDKARKLLGCVSDTSQDTWSFLTQGSSYLQRFRNPVDFSFLETRVCEQQSPCDSVTEGCTRDQRVSIVQLGVHCILLGALLADLCYGQNSHMVSRIRRILCQDEERFITIN